MSRIGFFLRPSALLQLYGWGIDPLDVCRYTLYTPSPLSVRGTYYLVRINGMFIGQSYPSYLFAYLLPRPQRKAHFRCLFYSTDGTYN